MGAAVATKFPNTFNSLWAICSDNERVFPNQSTRNKYEASLFWGGESG